MDDYQCECPSGYTDRHCETEINECDSTPCKHGAICHDQVAGYTCECPLGYSGFDCEVRFFLLFI